MFNHQNSICL